MFKLDHSTNNNKFKFNLVGDNKLGKVSSGDMVESNFKIDDLDGQELSNFFVEPVEPVGSVSNNKQLELAIETPGMLRVESLIRLGETAGCLLLKNNGFVHSALDMFSTDVSRPSSAVGHSSKIGMGLMEIESSFDKKLNSLDKNFEENMMRLGSDIREKSEELDSSKAKLSEQVNLVKEASLAHEVSNATLLGFLEKSTDRIFDFAYSYRYPIVFGSCLVVVGVLCSRGVVPEYFRDLRIEKCKKLESESKMAQTKEILAGASKLLQESSVVIENASQKSFESRERVSKHVVDKTYSLDKEVVVYVAGAFTVKNILKHLPRIIRSLKV